MKEGLRCQKEAILAILLGNGFPHMGSENQGGGNEFGVLRRVMVSCDGVRMVSDAWGVCRRPPPAGSAG